MTSNLPAERPESTLAQLDGQAALFENPTMLLDLDDVALKELAVLFGRHGASVFDQVRAQAGLLAWAGWFRFGEVTYSAFLLGLSKDLGVQPDTLMRWRRDVVRERRLPVPGVVKARSDAAKEGCKTAGQANGAGRSSSKSKPIPAVSHESPAKSSEGGHNQGHGPGRSEPASPSGPSSGGADVQPPSGPTDEAPTSPPSAPPGPHDDVPGSPDPAFQRPLNPPELTDEPVDVDAIGLRWLKSKTTQEVRAIGDPWGPAIRAEVRRWAEAFGAPPAPAEKPQRRQGTISRPADRMVERNVPPEPIGAGRLTRIGGGKRHADDCSCLSCKAPKAVAK